MSEPNTTAAPEGAGEPAGPESATRASFLRRRWKLLLALCVAAVVIGPYAVGRFRATGRRVRVTSDNAATLPGATAPPATLKIATYNIAHGRGPIDDNWREGGGPKRERVLQIAELLRRQNADVVVLNEVDFDATWSGGRNQAAAIARAAGFPHRVEQRNLDFRFLYGSWKFGNAVLSRFPIVEAELVEFPPLSRWESALAGHKRGVVCTLQLPNDRQVRVLAVHIETRSADVRVQCARRIAEIASESGAPLIAAGDFNSTFPGLPHFEQTAGGENAMSVLQSSGRFETPAIARRQEIGRERADVNAAPGPDHFTWSTAEPDRVIDWILIPSGWRFEEYRVLPSDLSDHRPVVAVVRPRLGGCQTGR